MTSEKNGLIQRFFSNLKNEAERLFNTALFLWHWYFSQNGCHIQLVWKTNLKSEREVLQPVFCTSWCPLYRDIFENLNKKKNIFCSFFALCLKWLILPYFCTKIHINPVIFCSTWLPSDSFWSLIPDHQMRKNKSTCWKWKTVIGLLSLSSSYQRYYLDLLPLEVWRP